MAHRDYHKTKTAKPQATYKQKNFTNNNKKTAKGAGEPPLATAGSN